MSAPALRFKEFDGDWKSFSLLDLSSDKTLNNGVFNDQNKVGKGYKLINVLDMYIDRDIDESRLSLLDLSKQEFERNKVKYGDIFFTRSSLVKEGIAYSNVYLGSSNDITYDGHLIKLSPNLEQINSIFLNYGLKTSKVRKQLIQGGKTATMTTIGQKEIASTKIDVPFLQEQTKIASFLSAIDEKISQLTQKHQLLSQYKQGMMQKLFSQQLRFKADDGSEFREWEEKELKDIAEINPKSKKLPESFIYIDLESVEKGQLLLQKNIELQDAPSRAQRLLAKGDVLFQMVRPYQQNNYYFNLSGEYVASTGYAQIRTKLDSKFIYYALHEKTFLDEVMNRCTGTSYPAINSSDLSSIEILIPCLEEQTKIANFLSAIDQKIEVVAQQIEQAKTWKKGLLQQMFI